MQPPTQPKPFNSLSEHLIMLDRWEADAPCLPPHSEHWFAVQHWICIHYMWKKLHIYIHSLILLLFELAHSSTTITSFDNLDVDTLDRWGQNRRSERRFKTLNGSNPLHISTIQMKWGSKTND